MDIVIHCGNNKLVITIQEQSIESLAYAIKYWFIDNKIDANIKIE